VNSINWNTNLIGYDALNSYGSPSYYMLGMFSQYHGNVVVPTQLSGTDSLYFVASKNTSNGTVYIKVVNPSNKIKSVQVVVNSGGKVTSKASAIVLSSSAPGDTNTLSDPEKIIPVTHQLTGLSSSFNYSFVPYSITVLVLTVS